MKKKEMIKYVIVLNTNMRNSKLKFKHYSKKLTFSNTTAVKPKNKVSIFKTEI